MTIFEVIEIGGPICAGNEDLGLLVTVNGAYVHLWVLDGRGGWTAADLVSGHPDLYKMTGSQMIDRAEECLAEWIQADDDAEAVRA